MGKNSHIEWTNHTFNPWWGCAKVSPACRNCYAEAWAKRVGVNVWGGQAGRRFFSENHWREPLKWNEEAGRSGTRSRVFCASMADVFERRSDLKPEREKLWNLIEKTPNLDWLILTKRPQNARSMAPYGDTWPENIWLGVTVENQTWAEKRIPFLMGIPVKTRFLSCEPLLGSLDISKLLLKGNDSGLHWIIAGGESGHHSRPMNPIWVRTLRDFCVQRNIAFHFKQWGHWAPAELLTTAQKRVSIIGDTRMAPAGKKVAGRVLDGRVWDELPRSA